MSTKIFMISDYGNVLKRKIEKKKTNAEISPPPPPLF